MPAPRAALVGAATVGALSLGLLPTAVGAPTAAADLRTPQTAVTAPASAVPAATGQVQVHYRVPTTRPVFFLTVDDGWSRQQAAADYVKTAKLPVTVFLLNAAVGGRWSFFRDIGRYDSVQNHTMTHRALTSLSDSSRRYEICQAQSTFAKRFGTRPWMLRPPYGAGFMPRRSSATRIQSTAASCGITHVVLWNVVVSSNGAMEYAGAPFRRGDIVLLHFNGNLKANLAKVVRLYRQRGLRPAPLSEYLRP